MLCSLNVPNAEFNFSDVSNFDQYLGTGRVRMAHHPVSASIGDRECCMLPPVNQESQQCCESNSTNPNPRSSNAWRRKRTASKCEPKLCRMVRSANFYPSRPGNSRPLRTSASGYRLPDTPATEVGEHHAPGNSKSSPRRTPT